MSPATVEDLGFAPGAADWTSAAELFWCLCRYTLQHHTHVRLSLSFRVAWFRLV